MKTTIDVWQIARSYLLDERENLSVETFNLCQGALRARDWKKLSGILGDTSSAYHELDETRVLMQMQAFFKKNAQFGNDAECMLAASKSFALGESLCRRTNRRLDHYGIYEDRLPNDLYDYISKMRKVIAIVLGDQCTFLESLPERVRITAGASEQFGRKRSLPYLKMRKKVSCTSTARPYVKALSQYLLKSDVEFRVVNTNRVTTVPKTSLTHRTVACEPVGNVPFQLAIDSYIKQRLKNKMQIDLSDQEKNQLLAKEGSLLDNLATIDLSMASDTLAYNVVPFLFPFKWFKMLDDLRSPRYKGIFGSGEYAKFSSMGNGFTFTVETLVFAAACVAVGSKRYSVYGDDIIIESELADDLFRILRFLGFRPNKEKSFSSGPFRESCGADFYRGVNIRPVFIRTNKYNDPTLCSLINKLVAIALPDGRLWSLLRDLVEKRKLPLVPYSPDDSLGIFCSPGMAWKIGVLRMVNWIPYFRGIVRKERTRLVPDGRGMLLWFFYKNSMEHDFSLDQFYNELGTIRCSRIPNGHVQYRRKMISWDYPMRGVPSHMYMWDTYITRQGA